MRHGAFRDYSCFSAGTYPTEKQRGGLMYQDFDYGLARERTVQMRKEVAHNRLDARLARAARSDGDGVASRGRVARGAALLTALFIR
jgi:hypothetical protein